MSTEKGGPKGSSSDRERAEKLNRHKVLEHLYLEGFNAGLADFERTEPTPHQQRVVSSLIQTSDKFEQTRADSVWIEALRRTGCSEETIFEGWGKRGEISAQGNKERVLPSNQLNRIEKNPEVSVEEVEEALTRGDVSSEAEARITEVYTLTNAAKREKEVIVEKFLQEQSHEAIEAADKIATLTAKTVELDTDISWVKTLLEYGLPVETVVALWDQKNGLEE